MDIIESTLEVNEDEMLRCVKHPLGGYCWPDLEEGNDSKHPDNPYHPWMNADELWICDVLFRKCQASTSVINEILGAIASN